jgi:A/G-specific adenine glycosylase
MSFSEKLLDWYRVSKRDLPWRHTKDPYLVWLSEIILQQTRVEQGRSYYERFVENYPTVTKLAQAKEDEVLKLWQGLGYYARARNMLATARFIVSELDGVFPPTYAGLRALKGVGDYSAAAIGSIAFNLPVPVVDGNVLRFVARFFGITGPIDAQASKNMVREIASEMITTTDPGTFNQAMMEFGAVYCKPANPDCGHCIFNQACFAFSRKLVDKLPHKTKPAPRKTRHFHYLVMFSPDQRSVVMKRRSGNDIWKGLYDFPLIETGLPIDFQELVNQSGWKELTAGFNGGELRIAARHRHILTHQTIMAVFYELTRAASPVEGHIWIDLADFKKYPVPRLIERYLQNSACFDF